MAVLVDPIRTEADYEAALVKVEELWGAKAGTPEGDKLDILVTLVDAWENAHYPMDPPDPVEAIKFRLEQEGKTQSDLARVLGSRSRASEVLSGKRELTMAQVRTIRANFGISADVLVSAKGGSGK